MELLTANGIDYLFRWGHVLAGITWIGLLYLFQFRSDRVLQGKLKMHTGPVPFRS